MDRQVIALTEVHDFTWAKRLLKKSVWQKQPRVNINGRTDKTKNSLLQEHPILIHGLTKP